jgi:hypothetical protein
MSAVNYVNDHYQQEPSQTENYLPLKSLRMEACTVFFQLKEEGDYLVLLTDFEIDTGESSQNIKGHKRRGAKAKARSSGSLSILIKFFCMILFDIMLCEHLASLFLNQVNFFFY